MCRVGVREYYDSQLLNFEFLWKSHTFPYTISPPLTTQYARASAILTQISGNVCKQFVMTIVVRDVRTSLNSEGE